MQSWHIHIEGRVQGVGFRPFIYRLATQMHLVGDVANTPNGVHIHLNATKEVVDEFLYGIKVHAPKAARISAMHCNHTNEKFFTSFNIVESTHTAAPKLLITPDIALCPSCKKELHDSKNVRFAYPFITCTHCGPRYSIMQNLPYDRERTSMNPFTMCPTCTSEFTNQEDKRFYSQTNSCGACGVNLRWLTNEPQQTDPIKHVAKLLHDGKIVAVKGIGGFLLLADATNKKAIERLRQRKHRPTKPFACMFGHVDQIKKYAFVTENEAAALQSNEAPIVLLKRKKISRDLAIEEIAPGLNRIGAMLPYAPLLELISAKSQSPLVATSANASGSPIVFKDDEALRLLGGIADAILTHDREITFPQDDSVVVFTPNFQKKIILRRARGYAPSVDFPENRLPQNTLGMGAEMKSAFGFTANGNTFLSQFLGDTENYESQVSYEHTLDRLIDLIQPQISAVAVDAHPNYFATQKGKEWAAAHNATLHNVQHHKAHFAAVLTEHDLLQQNEPILGVIWDGLGYGEDGNMWGSEFFVFEENNMKRIHHLGNFPIISGNRMAYEPSMATFAAMWPETPGKVWMRKRFTEDEQEAIPQIADHPHQMTSSMGRLFDAAAGLLCCKDLNTYEGEAALSVQVLAEKCKSTAWNPYCIALKDDTLNVQYLLEKMDHDLKNQVPEELIALRFHQTLVQYISLVADMNMIEKVAFSGGVFQNTLLVDLLLERLSEFHKLYFHIQLPPNDECIAIGQIALASNTLNQNAFVSNKTEKNTQCV